MYLIVYELTIEVDSVISPVDAFKLNPEGVAVKVPPASPVIVGVGLTPLVG